MRIYSSGDRLDTQLFSYFFLIFRQRVIPPCMQNVVSTKRRNDLRSHMPAAPKIGCQISAFPSRPGAAVAHFSLLELPMQPALDELKKRLSDYRMTADACQIATIIMDCPVQKCCFGPMAGVAPKIAQALYPLAEFL